MYNDSDIRWICSPIATLESHLHAWEAMVPSNSPFLSATFVQSVVSHFGSGQELFVRALSKEGSPLAYAIVTPTHFGHWSIFSPPQLPLGAFVRDKTVSAASIAKSLSRQLPRVCYLLDMLKLDLSQIGETASCDRRFKVVPHIETAWIEIQGSFDDYWNARPKSLRDNLSRQRRKLVRDGITARIDFITDPAAVREAIAEYGQLESSGWKSREGTAVHAENQQGRFYLDVLEKFCRNNRGLLLRYMFNDDVVAMNLCIRSDGTLVRLKTAYREGVQGYSPAMLLQEAALRDLWKNHSLSRVEFFGRAMDWHLQWTDKVRPINHLSYYRWPWLRQISSRLRSLQLKVGQPRDTRA